MLTSTEAKKQLDQCISIWRTNRKSIWM